MTSIHEFLTVIWELDHTNLIDPLRKEGWSNDRKGHIVDKNGRHHFDHGNHRFVVLHQITQLRVTHTCARVKFTALVIKMKWVNHICTVPVQYPCLQLKNAIDVLYLLSNQRKRGRRELHVQYKAYYSLWTWMNNDITDSSEQNNKLYYIRCVEW